MPIYNDGRYGDIQVTNPLALSLRTARKLLREVREQYEQRLEGPRTTEWTEEDGLMREIKEYLQGVNYAE